ncbi:HAMP domain-containing sensor histidine kinase [Alkalitalea saponilacus]|uniref:histidine kinase n=1 Tax=Alkalitalea saponilacus TaxID=889453 RepID=A0A1T5C8W6_9BACT|nr:HAMP domain-containing sensor histidine kinase [Alkalitalea saponilacus]ASB49773.1 two-component sensor histidine kinase [Alkalitalea saponilacus]SKB55816.1 Signal transduction histidine kinase [Alkalitalea saponilacus]
MKIRTKLTLIYTVISTAILLAFSIVIYYSAHKSRESEFFTALEQEAITKANLFFIAKVDTTTLQTIYRSNIEVINEVEVAIYDAGFNLLYHDAEDIDHVQETPEMIDEIIDNGEIRFYQDDWQAIGLRYKYNGIAYAITATAYDRYGYSKLFDLRNTMLTVLIMAMAVIYLAGLYFSKKAFDPVKAMIRKAESITASNLDLRLPSTGNHDELSQMADTFNKMLNRLEDSFNSQKEFVSNISHELRTPLAAMTTELDLAIQKERTTAEYQKIIKNVLFDSRRLAALSNNLLDLAKAGYDPQEISFKVIRMDEVLLDAMQTVMKHRPGYAVNLHFEDSEENDEAAGVFGNEYLLKTAFIKIMENGCKFSPDNRCETFIHQSPETITITIKDNGIGIPDDELPEIFKPFFRGSNRSYTEGNGIGLPLAQKIVSLHKGSISVSSQTGKGTTFVVSIPVI